MQQGSQRMSQGAHQQQRPVIWGLLPQLLHPGAHPGWWMAPAVTATGPVQVTWQTLMVPAKGLWTPS